MARPAERCAVQSKLTEMTHRMQARSGSLPTTQRRPDEGQILALIERMVRGPQERDPRRVLVQGLSCLPGVSGVWLGQPDPQGRVSSLIASDKAVQACLEAVEIRVDGGVHERGPISRAWHSGQLERVDDWRRQSEPAPELETLGRAGVVSSAAIVLHSRDVPREILVLHSQHADWFSDAGWPSMIAHLASVCGHILEQWDVSHRLEQLARLDPLTELPNRRALEEYLEQSIARGRREGRAFAAGMVDLDDFKPINDRFGHEAGDKLLQCVAQRLRSNLRGGDFVARLGGDEFVIVFDGFVNPDHLQPRLEELRTTITAPIQLEQGEVVRVEASLGLALCIPVDEGPDFSSTALLRRADLALYQAKREKLSRVHWWHMHTPGTIAQPSMNTAASSVPPYGESAARVLRPIRDLLIPVTERFAKALCSDLPYREALAPQLSALTQAERERIEARQRGYFTALTDPTLDEAAHDAAARRAGRINAACSLDEAWVTSSHEIYLETLLTALPHHAIRLRQALPVISARLVRDRQGQLLGYQEAAQARNAVIDALTHHLGYSRDCLQLTEVLIDALCGLEEVAAVCTARTGGDGEMLVTAVETTVEIDASTLSSTLTPGMLQALAGSLLSRKSYDEHDGYAIRHCRNFASAGALSQPMRDELYRLGLRSTAVLAWRDGRVPGYLWLFSRWPGGFSSPGQQAFLRQIGHLLSVGWGQLPDPGLFTVAERRRRRSGISSGALTMHYQPVIDLTSGRLVKVEALARMHEGARLLQPDEFLPLLDDNEMFSLFRLGLHQALTDAQRWAEQGQRTNLGVNIPPRGLADPRYLETTAQALAATPLPSGTRLYLEMLETGSLDLSDLDYLISLFQPWLDLGVHFSEDDLGTGHSSLLRLHRLPFELVKIDQGLVRMAERPEPPTIRKILAFVAGLTHLAHALGLKVCVEGLENGALVEAAAVLGADWGQGFAIARPMPGDAIIAWARTCNPRAESLLDMSQAELEAAYETLHEAVMRFGINSSAHAEAFSSLYGQLAERIASRMAKSRNSSAREDA